jgi:hypothetical protein
MSFPAVALSMAIAMTAAGCGGSSTTTPSIGTIDNAADVGALMDALAVPMAGLFTNLSNGAVVRADEASARSDLVASLTASASCPGGGTASYVSGFPSTVTFAACVLGGVGITGTLSVDFYGFPPSYGVNLLGGSLTLSGPATGTITVVNGTIQWTSPATDANTFWELTVSAGGSTYCAWSGGGACR